MARPRKNAAKVQGSLLAPDEVAEIPVEEQPYPLPEGWRWVRLGSTITLHRGVSYKKTDAHSIPSANDCLIMRGGNICEGSIELYTDNVYVDKSLISQDQFIKNLDIIIVTSTGSKNVIGRAGIAFQDYQNVAFGAFLTLARINDGYNKRYISFYFQSDLYRNRIRKLANGVSINNVRSEYITESELPFPPIDEQQRIVDRIESLFARLDEAKSKAEAVLDSFEIRKAVILHKAFTGELTAKWRDERGVDMKSWEYVKLSTVSRLQTGIMKGKKYIKETQKMPYLRVANVQDGYFDLNEIKEIDLPIDDMNRYLLRKGDVLFTEGGDFDKLGRGAVWNEEIFPCTHQNHIFVVRTDAKRLVPKFLSLQARSQYGKQYFLHCSKQTTNLASINSTQLKNFPLILPSVAEQQELVHILDNLLAKEQQAKEAAETVLHQLKLMKKAILARAFRGELGTHGSARDTLQNNGSM